MSTETLTCRLCGSEWERERKRGRKPRECPDCKSSSQASPQPPSEPKTPDDEAPHTEQTLEVLAPGTFDRAGEVSWGEAKPNMDALLLNETPSGNQYFDSFYLGKDVIDRGTRVKIKGVSGQFEFRGFVIQESGKPFIDLVGISGQYAGKSRTPEPGRVTI